MPWHVVARPIRGLIAREAVCVAGPILQRAVTAHRPELTATPRAPDARGRALPAYGDRASGLRMGPA